jgi:hypothetical protein
MGFWIPPLIIYIAGIQGKNRPLKEASLIFFRKLFKMKEEK